MKKIHPEDSYSIAENIMKERAVSFYQAFSKLPRNRFRGVAALYAFCRYADDLVDEIKEKGRDENLEKLNRLEEAIKGLYGESGAPIEEDWWPALVDTIESFQIPLDGFLQQIEGQRKDAFFKDIQTTEELLEYCRLVAGSVGRLLLPVLAAENTDVADAALIESCEDLGKAMQITNILRDVGEDLKKRNRLYLPKDLLESYGISRNTLAELSALEDEEQLTGRMDPDFIRLWEELALLADRLYFRFEESVHRFHPTCQFPLAAAALLYRGILDAVRKERYNCFTKRCYTDDGTRNKLLLQALKYKKTGIFGSSSV